MTLMLHKGAQEVGYDILRTLDLPEATRSHVPIGHHEVVEMVRYSLGFYGHEVTDEAHSVTPDGARYFGLLTLKSAYGDYTDTVGLRNSHDKTFPIGIAFGSRVFVCDNLAFVGDHVVRRKHTAKAKRDLPGLMAEIVEPLREHREAQRQKIERYRETSLLDRQADHAIMELYRDGVINVQRIAEVNRQWREPEFPEWGGKTAWRLMNVVTYVLTGKVAENPQLTTRMHQVIDGVCQEVA